VGRVERTGEEPALVAVDDPSGLTRVGDPTADDAAAAASNDPGLSVGTATESAAPVTHAGLADPFVPEVGVAGLVVIGLASIAVTGLRRRRIQHRFATRIAARLDALVPSTAAVGEPGRATLGHAVAADGSRPGAREGAGERRLSVD
jgi:hypothetical protein